MTTAPPYKHYAAFYKLSPECSFRDITEDLKNSPFILPREKQHLTQSNRRVCIFAYPSDGLSIYGCISFISEIVNPPTLVLLRGGNGIFGIINPADNLMAMDPYTVIATTYRGEVSEGIDEFGGLDVNDVKNLVDYLPNLEKQLSIKIRQDDMSLLGRSRGGMQVFLTLSRFPELQSRFSRVVSLSGVLDLQQWMTARADIKEMFIESYGLTQSNENAWITHRNPLLAANKINPHLPVLIIQGTEDERVDQVQGLHMAAHLQANGNNVTYWEIAGGDHCLNNRSDRAELIASWLASV